MKHPITIALLLGATQALFDKSRTGVTPHDVDTYWPHPFNHHHVHGPPGIRSLTPHEHELANEVDLKSNAEENQSQQPQQSQDKGNVQSLDKIKAQKKGDSGQ